MRALLLVATLAFLPGCDEDARTQTPFPFGPVSIAGPTPPLTRDYAADGFDVRFVTGVNRHYDGQMMGGWGPHLRPFLRDSQDRLWHVMDSGPDVDHNVSSIYYRFAGGRWSVVDSQSHIPGIQQNVASILAGDTIYGYGISIQAPRHLEECVFDASSGAAGPCVPVEIGAAPLTLPVDSNYVGAAVTPGGTRLVWWTRVGTPGLFSYVYNQGTGWSAPVVTDLGTYEAFSYVYVTFVSETEAVLGGELVDLPSGIIAAMARLQLGQPVASFSILYDDLAQPLESVEDLWLEPSTQTLHVAAHNYLGLRVGYLSVRLSDWVAGSALTAAGMFEDAFRARLLTSPGELHLLLGAEDGQLSPGLRDFTVPMSAAQSPIDWAAVPSRVVPMPALTGYEWPCAIYVEAAPYQTTPLSSPNFGFTGVYANTDDEIWHVQF